MSLHSDDLSNGAARALTLAALVRTTLDPSGRWMGCVTGAKRTMTKGTNQDLDLLALSDHRSGCCGDLDVDGYDDGAACDCLVAVQAVFLRHCGWMEPDCRQPGAQLFLRSV